MSVAQIMSEGLRAGLGCKDCSCKAVPLARAVTSGGRWELAALAGSLVASNCCVLQLLLNYFAVGCAGFSVFDRAKPLARTLTVIAILRLILVSKSKRALGFAVASALLLVSQDVLTIYNKGIQKGGAAWSPWVRPSLQQPVRQTLNVDADESSSRYKFHVSGMRCEGCAARLKAALLAVSRVQDVSIDFQHKQVDVDMQAQESGADDIQVLSRAIRAVDLGYDPVFIGTGSAG